MSEHDDKIFSEIIGHFEMHGDRLQEYEDTTQFAVQLQAFATETENSVGLPSAHDKWEGEELKELLYYALYYDLVDPRQFEIGDRLIVTGTGFISCTTIKGEDSAVLNHLTPESRIHGAVKNFDIMEVPRYDPQFGAFYNPATFTGSRRLSAVIELEDASVELLAGSDNPYFLALDMYKHIYIPLVYTEHGLNLRRRIESFDD